MAPKRHFVLLIIEFVDNQATAEFWFKPSCLRRHDVSGVGDVDELLHAHGIEGESHLHFSGIDAAFEFAKTTDTANEVDSLVAAEVENAKDVAEDEVA